MVKRVSPWIDWASQAPRERSQYVTGTYVGTGGDGVVRVAVGDAGNVVNVPSGGGVFAEGATVGVQLAADGRPIGVLEPARVPDGVVPDFVGASGLMTKRALEETRFLGERLGAVESEVSENHEALTAELADAHSKIEAAKRDTWGMMRSIETSVRSVGIHASAAADAVDSVYGVANEAKGAAEAAATKAQDALAAATGPVSTDRIVQGSSLIDGTLIEDGSIYANKIVATEELWGKLAGFAKVTTDQIVAGEARIAGELLADTLTAKRMVGGVLDGGELFVRQKLAEKTLASGRVLTEANRVKSVYAPFGSPSDGSHLKVQVTTVDERTGAGGHLTESASNGLSSSDSYGAYRRFTWKYWREMASPGDSEAESRLYSLLRLYLDPADYSAQNRVVKVTLRMRSSTPCQLLLAHPFDSYRPKVVADLGAEYKDVTLYIPIGSGYSYEDLFYIGRTGGVVEGGATSFSLDVSSWSMVTDPHSDGGIHVYEASDMAALDLVADDASVVGRLAMQPAVGSASLEFQSPAGSRVHLSASAYDAGMALTSVDVLGTGDPTAYVNGRGVTWEPTFRGGLSETAAWKDLIRGYTPVGGIIIWPGGNPPDGWMECGGQELSASDYPELFSVIGYTYGGSGKKFRLPALNGRMPVGHSSAYPETDTMGKTGGETRHALTVAEMPAHSHTQRYTLDAAKGTSMGGMAFGGSRDIPGVTSQQVTMPTGGGAAHNNMPPYLVVRFAIRVR